MYRIQRLMWMYQLAFIINNMAQVKQVGEKIRADETRDKADQINDTGIMTVFTNAEGTINPAFIDLDSIGVERAFTQDNKDKIATIGIGAEENVRANWGQTDTNADDFIRNKPTFNNRNRLQGVGNYTIGTIHSTDVFRSTGISFNVLDSLYWVVIFTRNRRQAQEFPLSLNSLRALPISSAGSAATNANSLKVKFIHSGAIFIARIGRSSGNNILVAINRRIAPDNANTLPSLRFYKAQ